MDGITIERFEKQAEERLLAVKEQIERGDYHPQLIKRVWIDKPGSTEKRPLGIPTVRDRVVQTALRAVVEPIFEREFAPQSYGFRPGRGCKDALRRVDEKGLEMVRYADDMVVLCRDAEKARRAKGN